MSKRKRFVSLGGFLLLIIVIVAGWMNHRINASLPLLDATLTVQGIHAKVVIERDAFGIPTISTSNREDAAFALGFLHGQDRFFQMDLLRRSAAGRIAELFGEAAVNYDAAVRKHRFEELAIKAIRHHGHNHLELLTAYTAGVNSGLENLGDKPFEYLLLRVNPEPWQIKDSALVGLAMLCSLQDQDGRLDRLLGQLKANLPNEAFHFLARQGTEWDAALDGTLLPEPPIPTLEIWKFDREEKNAMGSDRDVPDPKVPGSNNWAIGGTLTDDGRSIVASDMHLGLSVPAIWYRAVMITNAHATDREVRLVGVTLPGTPALVAGSNGSVAWGFTNSMGDFGDLIELQLLEGSEQYLTADGPQKLERFTHSIQVKGGATTEIETRWTRWGPVTVEEFGADGSLRQFAHHWVGHDPRALNFHLVDLEATTTVAEAIGVANGCGMAQNNMVCADATGQVGWTIAGRIPKRLQSPARTPLLSTDENIGWDGYLAPDECPRIIDPENDRVWSANSRVIGGTDFERVGGEYVLGARATQIRDRLLAKDQFNENDLLQIQLDDEAKLMQRWHRLLVDVMASSDCSVSDAFRKYVNEWSGHAAIDSVGYRIVRDFRESVSTDLESALTATAPIDRSTMFWGLQNEGFVWRIIQERPAHLLPSTNSWEEYLATHAVGVESHLTSNQPLSYATWGQVNQTEIRHPFSSVMPFLSRWLDMPTIPLPGDSLVPRVQRPNFGASNRMVVSPGHEEQGILHIPGGQSGHPRSPYYRKGFTDWAEGKPTPILPGPTKHRLVLQAKGP